MTSNARIMQRLLWKDAMLIKPLVIAIVTVTIALNLMFLVFSHTWQPESTIGMLFACWILMPNLVALGTPALLVGNEEELGTLVWLRTLPLRWQQIADSKLFVSLAAVLGTWMVASLMLAISLSVVSTANQPFSEELLVVTGVAELAFFSVLLLLCGFTTAYLFRSPVTALVVLVPIITVVNSLALTIGRWILYDHFVVTRRDQASVAAWITVVTLAAATLIAFWLAQRLLARRRLSAPNTVALDRVTAPTMDASRPPVAKAGLDQPSPMAALLWQQSRQLGWPGILLFLVAAMFLVLHRFVDPRNDGFLTFLHAVALPVVALSACWLGGMTFYGDNVRRRCAFFADRGISPRLIWWSRVSIPTLMCLALILLQLFLVVGAADRQLVRVGYMMAGSIAVLFAFGQLVSQWMPRATLTFFAAPTYAWFSFMVSTYWWGQPPIETSAALVIFPVLLLATRHLTGRWLCGKIDFGFHWRVVAYTVLALSLPSLAVI